MIEWIRTRLQQRPYLMLLAAALPIALAALFTTAHFVPDAAPEWPMAYYMDEETGEITTRPANEFPPLAAATGRLTIVRAIFLTPSDPVHKFLAYLEKYDDDALAKIKRQTVPANGPSAMIPALHQGILIRLPKAGSPWQDAGSSEGAKLMDSIYRSSPNGAVLRLCPP